MPNVFGNLLIQRETLCFPRTPIGAYICRQSSFWLWVWAVTFPKLRHGIVTPFVTGVVQSNHILNLCRDAVTGKIGVPVCVRAPVRRRLCAWRIACHGVTASRHPSFFLSITIKRKGISGVKAVVLPVTFAVTNLPVNRENVTGCESLSPNPLKYNKKGGF